jgi:mRNA guanylyltransferase
MNTLVDGELVIDVDPATKKASAGFSISSRCRLILVMKESLRFLAFDCLVADNQNVMSKPLDKRYGVCYLAVNSTFFLI